MRLKEFLINETVEQYRSWAKKKKLDPQSRVTFQKYVREKGLNPNVEDKLEREAKIGMSLKEAAKQFVVYYDYTGAGRRPEPVAGPFDSRKEAEEYAEENDMPLKGDNYFVDEYHED